MPELRQYQKDALNWLTKRQYGALFADPGTGKTLIILSLLRRLSLLGERSKVLITAPLRVIYNVWPAEIEKWGLDFSCHILHGRTKDISVDADIHLINPEGLKWLAKQELPDYDIFVLDESSLFRNPTSVRMKILRGILPRFKRRYILTGTPQPKGIHDLWSQMYIVDRGASLGTRVTHFRNAYFYHEQRHNIHKYHIIPGMDDVINKRIAPLCYRIDAETHLDLPPLVVNDIKVSLPSEARTIYDDMEKKLFAEIDGEERFASTASVAYSMCCQLASGTVYQEGSTDYTTVHTAKIAALDELRNELGGKPLLVVFRYRHEMDVLQARIRDHFPMIVGGTGERTVTRLLDAWNRGELPLLGAQYQSISHGLNMQAGGNDIVWYTLTDDYDVYEQLNRRIYRSGVKGQVRIHRLLAERTVDHAIARSLAAKERGQTVLFDALCDYRTVCNH